MAELTGAATKPARLETTTIAKVTAGPATAISNSAPGLSVSRSIRATPPKIQSWMLEMPIPRRSAEKAWPSSCRTIEPKKPTAAATASPNGSGAVLDSPNWSPKRCDMLRMRKKKIRNQDQSTEILIPRT